jgi:hypothetical protein
LAALILSLEVAPIQPLIDESDNKLSPVFCFKGRTRGTPAAVFSLT